VQPTFTRASLNATEPSNACDLIDDDLGERNRYAPDGTVRILRRWAHPVAYAHRRTVRVFTIVQDVTDQCQAELEHRALRVRFARAFESAPHVGGQRPTPSRSATTSK
jgi:PAS domain-containing protein